MRFRNGAFWKNCEFPNAACRLFLMVAFGFAYLVPVRLQAQTLTGATVQVGQTGLTLPPGNSIYIYGMGTGGAAPATNFAGGAYTQVVDVGGQVVAGLAMTQSNSDSFTSQCADNTVGGVAVTGFRTVSAWYGANNQLHPTSASVTFPASQAAVAVIFAIAGGEDHLTVEGMPGLQIDAQKPNDTHGIAIAIGHASLPPGTYTVTETTEGDPGRDHAHEGDLLGVFLFTGGSGTAPTVTSNPPPLPLGPAAPPYAFNGAYVNYAIRYGPLSIPLKVSIDHVDPVRRTFNWTLTFGEPLASLSTSDSASFDGGYPGSPKSLMALRAGIIIPGLKLPDDFQGRGVQIFHKVRVSIPGGSFFTEQVVKDLNSVWLDENSGVVIRVESPTIVPELADRIPNVPKPATAGIELLSTNIPMSPAGPDFLSYGLVIGLILLALTAGGYAFVRRGRSTAQSRALASGPSGPSVAPAPIGNEALDKLAKLKSLLDAGLITQEELDRTKAKLLGRG